MFRKNLFLIFILVLLLLPSIAFAVPGLPIVQCGTSATADCTRCDLFKLLKNLIDFTVGVLMPAVAILLFVWAGFLILLGGANTNLVTQGRQIFSTTFFGILIMLSAWMITNTLIKSIGSNYDKANTWWQFECVETVPVGPPPSGQPPSGSCNQNFGLTPSSGCSGTACVDVSNITPTHGCESHDGVCLTSAQAAQRARNFISAFNDLSGGQCSLRLSSTIQGGGGPSISQCHKPGTSKSGTCADFNLLPNYDSCRQYFYQAARDSDAVVSFLDEYAQSCRPAQATGGNIHVNF